MAISPTWLNFASPSDVLANVANAQARQQALALQAQEQAARQALAQQQMAQRAALAQLENESDLVRIASQQQMAQQQFSAQQAQEAARQAQDAMQFQLQRDKFGFDQKQAEIDNTPFTPNVVQGLGLPEWVTPVQTSRGQVQLVTDPTRTASTKTSAERNADAIINSERRISELLAQGDEAGASQERQRAEILKSGLKGMEFEMTTDETGKPVFRAGTKGITGAKDPKQPTTSTLTEVQKNLTKYENAINLIDKVQESLRRGDVGPEGFIKENVVDKFLANFTSLGIEVDKERVKNRQAIGLLREGLMRQVSDDTRFSNQDAARILEVIPSTGMFESYDSAIEKLNGLKDTFKDRGNVYSASINTAPPDWAYRNRNDVKTSYQSGFYGPVGSEEARAKAKAIINRLENTK